MYGSEEQYCPHSSPASNETSSNLRHTGETPLPVAPACWDPSKPSSCEVCPRLPELQLPSGPHLYLQSWICTPLISPQFCLFPGKPAPTQGNQLFLLPWNISSPYSSRGLLPSETTSPANIRDKQMHKCQHRNTTKSMVLWH